MRTLRLYFLAVCILALTAPPMVRAQTEEESESAEAEAEVEKKKDTKAPAPLGPPGPVELPPPAAPAGDALPPPPPGFTEVSMDQASPVKPPLNLLDLHGYLRMRGDLMDGLDLGLDYRLDSTRGAAYPQFPKSATGKKDTLAGANMRFRLEPTINISEDVRIMSQIDMLDNLILGSTPDGYPKSPYYPLVGFSQGQQAPMEGVNWYKDSILVRRVWGEAMTPLGLLRFGRMGSQWGLGLLASDGGPTHVDRGPLVTRKDPFSPMGHCFDCDYGSTADRIMFITKIFGHYVVPMIDFTAEGPYYVHTNEYQGQPFDLDQLDDVNSYILAITKRDKPEDIEQALAQDDWVLNYGVYFVFRNQALDAIEYQTMKPDEGRLLTIENYAIRNIEAYIPDIWVRFMYGKLRIELEAVMIIGKIGYDFQAGTYQCEQVEPFTCSLVVNPATGQPGQKIDLLQFGGVLQADYRMLDDSLLLGLEFGFASGDDSPGFGVRPFDEKQFEHADGDHDINNFRFHPDYHVDMILWRQIIGTVTDAWYAKPSLQYEIAEGFGAKISAIYSSVVCSQSARGKQSPLGLEFDMDFFYFSDDNFHAGLSYGLLIPLAGMNDLGDDERRGGISDDQDDDANIAHRILGRLVLFF